MTSSPTHPNGLKRRVEARKKMLEKYNHQTITKLSRSGKHQLINKHE